MSTGGGNQNVFTTFKGRYELTPEPEASFDTPVVMLSCVNDVQIIGDVSLTNYIAGMPIATLPTQCTPGKLVKVPVIADDGAGDKVVTLTVDTSGIITLPFDYATAAVYFSGMNFNISDNWY